MVLTLLVYNATNILCQQCEQGSIQTFIQRGVNYSQWLQGVWGLGARGAKEVGAGGTFSFWGFNIPHAEMLDKTLSASLISISIRLR